MTQHPTNPQYILTLGDHHGSKRVPKLIEIASIFIAQKLLKLLGNDIMTVEWFPGTVQKYITLIIATCKPVLIQNAHAGPIRTPSRLVLGHPAVFVSDS